MLYRGGSELFHSTACRGRTRDGIRRDWLALNDPALVPPSTWPVASDPSPPAGARNCADRQTSYRNRPPTAPDQEGQTRTEGYPRDRRTARAPAGASAFTEGRCDQGKADRRDCRAKAAEPTISEEEYKVRGDAADRLWRELVRRVEGRHRYKKAAPKGGQGRNLSYADTTPAPGGGCSVKQDWASASASPRARDQPQSPRADGGRADQARLIVALLRLGARVH